MPVGSAPARHSVEWFNAASVPEFAAAMAPLFEGAPRFLSRLAAARPFADDADMFTRAGAIALAMPEDEQTELIDAHPRIGAQPGSMSVASFVEQGFDQDAAATAEASRAVDDDRVAADLDRLNTAYEARFGFRFVVFVAGRPRSEIVPVIEKRLGGTRREEMDIALANVVAIALDRWRKAA